MSTAVGADDPAGKRRFALGVATRRLTPAELLLHHLEHLRADDGGMIILNIVLRVFPLIFLRFLGQKIYRKAFVSEKQIRTYARKEEGGIMKEG